MHRIGVCISSISDKSIDGEHIKGRRILWYKSANVLEKDRIEIKNSLVALGDTIKEAMKFTRNMTRRPWPASLHWVRTEVLIDFSLPSLDDLERSHKYFLTMQFDIDTYDPRVILSEENSGWTIQLYRRSDDTRWPKPPYRGELVGKIGGTTRYEQDHEEDTV